MNREYTLEDLDNDFPTNNACLEWVKDNRWPTGIYCFKCGRLRPHSSVRERTAYCCNYCGDHVYPTAGTIFHKSTSPLRTWFYVMFRMVSTWGKIPALQIQKEVGVTYKTAWRMCHLIKEHLGRHIKEVQLESESLGVFTEEHFYYVLMKACVPVEPIHQRRDEDRMLSSSYRLGVIGIAGTLADKLASQPTPELVTDPWLDAKGIVYKAEPVLRPTEKPRIAESEGIGYPINKEQFYKLFGRAYQIIRPNYTQRAKALLVEKRSKDRGVRQLIAVIRRRALRMRRFEKKKEWEKMLERKEKFLKSIGFCGYVPESVIRTLLGVNPEEEVRGRIVVAGVAPVKVDQPLLVEDTLVKDELIIIEDSESRWCERWKMSVVYANCRVRMELSRQYENGCRDCREWNTNFKGGM